MRDDADLIRKAIEAWFSEDLSGNEGRHVISDHRDDMARVLAVVRAHDATPARRVPVQIVNMTQPNDVVDTIIALANDGSLHRGKCGDDGFRWGDQLPPLPQPGDGA